MGGGFGAITGFSTLTDCRSLAIRVSATRSGYTQSSVISGITIGGFVGSLQGSGLKGCYARTEVSASGYGPFMEIIAAGGLVGSWIPTKAYDITECYASGNVVTAGSCELYAGGLVGQMTFQGNFGFSLNNSYALGSIRADQTGNSNTYAGGLVGVVDEGGPPIGSNLTYSIQYCFASGTVSTRSCDTGNVYSGGIVGRITVNNAKREISLTCNAAIGPSVTAMGGGIQLAGRIYGAAKGTIFARNFAQELMFVGTASTYTASPYPAYEDSLINDDEYYEDGLGVSPDLFASGLTNAGTGSWLVPTILNFNPNIWDFSTISRGYPKLVGVGGQ